MDPKESLKHIGLNEKEIQIYLSLLELGSSTVLAIAKRSGIKRPTAYLVLQSLVEKGFASRIIKGKNNKPKTILPLNGKSLFFISTYIK